VEDDDVYLELPAEDVLDSMLGTAVVCWKSPGARESVHASA
jgi:hypothetical protein